MVFYLQSLHLSWTTLILLCMTVQVFSIYSPLSSACITPSLQPTSQQHPLSRFVTIPLSLLHTTIHQTSYIFNQWICRFRVIFRHVQTCLYDWYTITMKISWLLGITHHHVMVIMVTKHVQTCLYMSVKLPTHDSSAFQYIRRSLSIHNSFTPTNILIASTRPFCHNTTFTSTYNHPSNFLHFQQVDVSFSRLCDWTCQLLTLHC